MSDIFADQHRWWKPKFLFAMAVFIVGSAALFFGKIGGGEWVAAATMTLAVFTAGNVVENKAVLASK